MKRDRFITLEIGTEGIRLAAFALSGSGSVELLDHGSVRYDSNPPRRMTREAVMATTLKRLLDEKNIPVRKAVVVIEGQAVFSRLVKLPAVRPDKLQQTIRHEAMQQIPFPIGEVVWDSHLADTDVEEPEVLLVAVKSELVDGLIHAVEASGLEVDAVDVAPAALANVVRHRTEDRNESLLIVDIGAPSTTLVFMDGGRTLFRSLPMSGNMLPRLVQEIERSISFYLNQLGGRIPQRILLMGELDDPDMTTVQMAERLKLPVEDFDPLEGISCPTPVADDVRSCMGALAGVAIQKTVDDAISINLLPEAMQKERSFRRRQPKLLACAVTAIAIVLVWVVGLRWMAELVQRESGAIAARIETLEAIEDKLVPLEGKIAGLQQKVGTCRKAIRQKTYLVKMLDELRDRLPDGMFLLASEPLRNGNAVKGMRVTVVSYLDKELEDKDPVVLLRNNLRASEWFSDESRVFTRPAKQLFARRFVLDLIFEEPMSQ